MEREPLDPSLDPIAQQIVDSAFKVHSVLGPGLLEQIYETCIAKELVKRGLRVDRQLEVPVSYDGEKLDTGFRLDLLVDEKVIIEVKAVESLASVHHAQILTYLKLSGRRLGLLINFNVPVIRQGIKRVVL